MRFRDLLKNPMRLGLKLERREIAHDGTVSFQEALDASVVGTLLILGSAFVMTRNRVSRLVMQVVQWAIQPATSRLARVRIRVN